MDEWIESKYTGYFVNRLGDVKGRRGKILLPKLEKNNGNNFYAAIRIGHAGQYVRVHRLVAEAFIENPEDKSEVDHINRDSLDNRVENLRWVTKSENQINKKIQKNNTTGRKNLYYVKKKDSWTVIIQRDKVRHQSYFSTQEEAEEFLDGLQMLNL